MTFLPIVTRELRVAARRRRTYLGRILFAFLAIITGMIIFFLNFYAPAAVTGKNIFIGIAVIAMLYALVSGRFFTADSMSEEKRDGTLGLLFLTDLKGYDVVLGKLVAASLGAFYGLLAILPVLSVPMLLGGVTNGEIWRMALVLISTFLFSLSIGITGSVISHDARGAMAANFALFLSLFIALPLLCFGVAYLGWKVTPIEAFVVSPAYGFYMCADANYKTGWTWYWYSLGSTHLLTWLLLIWSSWKAPRTWQEKPKVKTERTSWRKKWREWNYGREETRGPYRKSLLDINAFYWLAARAQRKPAHVWFLLTLALLWWIVTCWQEGRLFADEITRVFIAILLNSTFKCWVAIESGQQLAEDRKAGSLELILSTPLGVRDILRGQYLALRRQFFKPLLVLIAVEIVFTIVNFCQSGRIAVTLWTVGLSMFVADILTLSIVSLRNALTATAAHRVATKTFFQILILPWLLFGLVSGIANLWSELVSTSGSSISETFYLLAWFITGIAVDLYFGLKAWHELTHNFRTLAIPRYTSALPTATADTAAPKVSSASQGVSSPVSEAPRPFFTFKKKLAAASIVTVLATVAAIRASMPSKPQLPPPIVVTLGPTNTALNVSGGTTMNIVLPDGSLWQWGSQFGTRGARIQVPERIATNITWREASQYQRRSGLTQDGRLFDLASLSNPKPVDPSTNWIGVRGSFALKSDGSVWSTLEYAVGLSTKLTQIGTNTDWKDVMSSRVFVGLKTNGTLWTWLSWSPGTNEPAQHCPGTNWTALVRGYGIWARAESGSIYAIHSFGNIPTLMCKLISTNALPNHVSWAWTSNGLMLYEIRADGTLWQKNYPYIPPDMTPAPAASQVWQRVGDRSDWQELHGGNSIIGVTADGTLWMWGLDGSREITPTFSERLADLQTRIMTTFGTRPPNRASPVPYATQDQPRPLIQIKSK